MNKRPADRLNEDGEIERYCSKCREWWPADGEFFYTTGKASSGMLMDWCKACYKEWRNPRRRQKKLISV